VTQSYTIHEIGDLQAIRRRLAQHSMAIDRCDLARLKDCYHPDGTVEYRFFDGPADQFADILVGAQTGQPVTLHRTAQMWVQLDGDRANTECYVMAYCQVPDPEGIVKQRFVCGRYLDRLEKRDGEWRLNNRAYVLDSNVNWPGSFAGFPPGPLAHHVPVGGQGAADPGSALLTLAAAKNRHLSKGTTAMSSDQTIANIIAKQEIADLTMAYSRGVDRADEELLKTVFHPDSVMISGVVNDNGHVFAKQICEFIKANMTQTFHSIANQWIEVDGDGAVGETYVIALATSKDEANVLTDTFTGGRYIDRFTRVDGRWGIAERTFVCDWTVTAPTTRVMDSDMYQPLFVQGSMDRSDPVYATWG
jgi:hypothetical protein